jgi:preprotein translocase subunit SecF
MELFGETKFDFLGKKAAFLVLSVVLLGAGIGSLVMKGGPKYGIDFRGGTQVYVKFASEPPVNDIRNKLSEVIEGEITVQELGSGVQGANSGNEVIIGTEMRDERQLNEVRENIVATLEENFGGTGTKPDFNGMTTAELSDALAVPLTRNGVALSDTDRKALVEKLVSYRDNQRSGLVESFDELASIDGVAPGVIETLKQDFALGSFAIRQVEIVGPKVGADLRRQAILATLYALGGMLVYIAFRFEWMYGVAAVIAVFHDVLITVGLFSIFDKEISLPVIAALLTLVGYSMNDTIVVFDRIRENLKISRREPMVDTINKSINQTLSRTVITSGLTLLSCLALLLFGGQVLNGFAFALVVGIVIGTYSSIFIASPVLEFWTKLAGDRRRTASSPARASR